MSETRREAHDVHVAERAASMEAVCPFIAGNPFIPHMPLPAQAIGLGMHLPLAQSEPKKIYELLYGGAAGGGKSDWLLMAAAQYAWKNPEFRGVVVRRTYQQLTKADGLLPRAMNWWNKNNGVHWNGTDKKFTFPGGATVELTHHGHPKDDENFQGAAYQLACFDELTHWPDDSAYKWIAKTRMRRAAGSPLPLRALSASNPGSAGHVWVKNRFVGGGVDEHGDEIIPVGEYLPARIVDNKYLDRESYILTLMDLHPTVREQLLNGDWGAREPGDYFRAEWFGELLDPETETWPDHHKVTVRWWDLAASEKADAAHTVGVKMARHLSGVRAIEHVRTFKRTPGARDDMIVSQARLDSRHCIVGIEIEPGSGGIAQFLALEARLRREGFRVVGARPTALTGAEALLVVRAPSSDSGKAARCDPVSSCLERGFQRRGESDEIEGHWWGLDLGRAVVSQRDGIRLYRGSWTQPYLDKVEGFPDQGLDEGDATSGAWAYLEAHPPGRSIAGSLTSTEAPRVQLQDMHPADRPKVVEAGRDRAGHWKP